MIGTGVFITLGPRRFLVTAAHVFERAGQRPPYAGSGENLYHIAGDRSRLFAQDSPDCVDVRVVCLTGETWESTPDSQFLRWKELDHLPAGSHKDAFGIVGYPASKQKISQTGEQLRTDHFSLVEAAG